MNAYMYHMLLQARAEHWRSLEIANGHPARCPFCAADKKQTQEDAITAGFVEGSRTGVCLNCPLLNLLAPLDLSILMEDCVDLGRHVLQRYEETGQ